MPKGLIAGTLYLVTVDAGEYRDIDTPFRLYGTRVKADRFIERIKRHYAKRPKEPAREPGTKLQSDYDIEHDEWWRRLQEWGDRHPGGKDNMYNLPGDWKVRPMPVC